tara:strand:- start:818 stop:1693 length:876 start_codon:yes stop_codon:yes gene_type:complete
MAKLGVTPTHKKVDDIKKTILSPSLTPYFEVQFPVPPFLQGLMGGDTDPNKYLTILCTEAVLPGNNLITFNVDNDYSGVTEQMPHRKVYDQKLNLTFYVNAEGVSSYYPIRFFESYIAYIAGEDPSKAASLDKLRNSNYFYRMTYPDAYMVDSPGLLVKKFEKGEEFIAPTLAAEVDRELTYEFIRTFPTAINSMPLSYGDAQVLKCTVTYSYIRYIMHNTFKVDRTEPVRSPLIPSVPEPVVEEDGGNGVNTTGVAGDPTTTGNEGEVITQEQIESISFYDEDGNFIGDQ